jgi:hypothetical protein
MNFYLVGFYPKRAYAKKWPGYITVRVVANEVEQAKLVARCEIKAENPAFNADEFDVDVSAPIHVDAQ